MPEPLAEAPEPLWRRLEIIWPLSILIGFGGTFIGLRSGIPGAAAVLAFAGFAPLYRDQLRADRRLSGALLATVWLLGIIGAAVGEALEGRLAAVLEGLPLAATLVESELGRSGAGGLANLPRNALVVCALLVLGRPVRGLVALAGSALLAGALAGVAASAAVSAVEQGLAPSLAAVAGLPPHLLLLLLAVQLGAVALAEPGLESAEPFTDLRRALLFSALGLAGIALSFQGLWVRAWQQWQGG